MEPLPADRPELPLWPARQSCSLVRVCLAAADRGADLGEDRFVFAREGKDRFNQSATWTIEVNVQVKERL